MACECPGCPSLTSRTPTNTSIQTTNTDYSTPVTDTTPDDSVLNAPIARTTTVESKLTKAQQILAIKESMDEEEHGAYLDTRDMGEDFYSVGL